MWVNLHTHKELPYGVVGIRNIDNLHEPLSDKGFYSIALHPWKITDTNWINAFKDITQISLKQSIKAIGECGFDKFKGNSTLQDSAFLRHIELSEFLKKPLIIHSVGGENKILEYRKKTRPLQPWIIHSFIGNSQTAKELARNSIYCSFSSRSLMHKKTMEVFKQYPSHLSFLETDDSSTSIEQVYQQASILLNIEIEKLKSLYYNNFKNLFKLNE